MIRRTFFGAAHAERSQHPLDFFALLRNIETGANRPFFGEMRSAKSITGPITAIQLFGDQPGRLATVVTLSNRFDHGAAARAFFTALLQELSGEVLTLPDDPRHCSLEFSMKLTELGWAIVYITNINLEGDPHA